MNAARYILSSLRHFWRIHLAVAMGVAVATAVLTGALLVGDSMRGSLRDLTLQRLGAIDSAIVAGHLFRDALAQEIAESPEFLEYFTAAEPAILLNGTLLAGNGADVRRATSISVVGYLPEFWSLGKGGPAKELTDDEVALTESVAHELNVKVGDNVLLRIPFRGAVPADSPLGDKETDKTSRSRRFQVAAVLSPVGLARFGLTPSQQLPRNAFVPLGTLQKLLDKSGKANALLIAANQSDTASSDDAQRALQQAFKPRAEDFGLHVDRLSSPTQAIQISSDELVLPDEVVRAAEKAFPKTDLQPVVTYLANTISLGPANNMQKIPYSTIAGVDSLPQLGPVLDSGGKPIELHENEIVLNRWAADDLKAKVGDYITVRFYEPESTHGRLREREPPPTFKLTAIVELKTADGTPTAAADPKLTPEMPGVTDQKSISDWDLPFELVEKIRPQDETYWDDYRTTPKAFVSLAKAKRLWASRWGTISLLRLRSAPADARATVDAESRLVANLDPAAMGIRVLPAKKLGLQASAGTTPFGGLFLGFSFFLIAAAVLLVALLFQLGVQQRLGELGTLTAVGVGRPRIAALLSREGAIIAAIGATVGVAAGVLYAWLVIYTLTHWWVAAISTPFLRLHIGWLSLSIGWLAGVIVSWIAIRLAIQKLVRLPAARLLSGSIDGLETRTAKSKTAPTGSLKRAIQWPVFRAALIVLAIVLCSVGFVLHGEAQAGIFFGSGAIVLTLLLGEIRYRQRLFRWPAPKEFSLSKLSALNTARNPGRSTLTIGLVAAASFLIIAISAFRLETGDEGTGGFEYLAISDQPIYYDLTTPDGRRDLGLSGNADRMLNDWRVYSFRVAAGEDASCLNLYQPTQPRVLGVPESLIERGGFGWAATASGHADKPWTALNADLGRDSRGTKIVPAVLDMSTAVYSLHLSGVGSRLTIRDATGRRITAEVVGLLANSVLQGNLLVNEASFLQIFPDTGGYRFFLIEKSPHQREREAPDEPLRPTASGSGGASSSRDLPNVLESALADEGFDVVDAREQLAEFLAVQNTYLSTFQSLGALGLLFGTVGLAVVQLRSVLERRGELALMRASGFPRGRLRRMVVWENAVLLVTGLAVGSIAAAVALIPQWAPHGATIPWGTLAILLLIIAVVGIVAGWLTTRRALAAPIVPALRGD
jgi:ABC-type lipoprotein release transport system permease subunit